MKRILIVENDLHILEVVEIILKQNGFETYANSKSEDIIVNVEIFNPQLILLSQNLGVVNSSDVCNHLKTDPKTKDIPVIVFSIHSSEGINNSCHPDDFIDKPFDIKNLLNRIQIQLDKQAF